MQQIYASNIKISDSQSQQVAVIHEFAGIPRKHENTVSNDDTEDFSDAVKKEIVVYAG